MTARLAPGRLVMLQLGHVLRLAVAALAIGVDAVRTRRLSLAGAILLATCGSSCAPSNDDAPTTVRDRSAAPALGTWMQSFLASAGANSDAWNAAKGVEWEDRNGTQCWWGREVDAFRIDRGSLVLVHWPAKFEDHVFDMERADWELKGEERDAQVRELTREFYASVAASFPHYALPANASARLEGDASGDFALHVDAPPSDPLVVGLGARQFVLRGRQARITELRVSGDHAFTVSFDGWEVRAGVLVPAASAQGNGVKVTLSDEIPTMIRWVGRGSPSGVGR